MAGCPLVGRHHAAIAFGGQGTFWSFFLHRLRFDSTSIMPTHPPVLWAQRKDYILVSIQVDDIHDEKIQLEGNKLVMSCRGGKEGVEYAVDLEFYSELVPQESLQRKGGREFYFQFKKKDTAASWWPRLLKDKIKHPYVKVDFNRWKEEDDSDQESGRYDDANLEDMMKNMGGGGDFDPGDIPDSEDSDDEDIPDLEEDVSGKIPAPASTEAVSESKSPEP